MGGKRWRPLLTLALLSAALFHMLYAGGGLRPSARAIASAMIAMAALVLPSDTTASKRRNAQYNKQGRVARSVKLAGYVLLGYAVAQLIPIPLVIMQVISPARAASMRAAIPVVRAADWAPVSVSPARSLLELLTVLDSLLVCICVRRLGSHSRTRWWIVAPLLIAGLAEALTGVLQAGNPNGPATATGTFLNRNHLAGFLELLIPFPLAVSWYVWCHRQSGLLLRVIKVIFPFGCALLFISAVFETYSRMGLVIVLFVVLVSMGITLWPHSQVSVRNLSIAFTLLVVLLTAGLLAAPSRLSRRFQHASTIDRESTQIRIGIWKDSLPLLADYAFTGSGLGTFESVFPKYQRTGTAYRIEYAHNDYLQAAVEFGLLAFTAGLFILGSLIVRFSRSIQFAAGLETRCMATACFSSFSGILLHSLVDFNLRIPANAITFAWVVGLGLSVASLREVEVLK